MDKHSIIGIEETTVTVPIDDRVIEGALVVPENAVGIVLFAHGSGSGRFSPRNRFVAEVLQRGGLATLLIDLLTPGEESLDLQTAELRFDIPLLSRRLIAAIDWTKRAPEIQNLNLGCFGASTGAAAALMAAVERPRHVQAIVSRGGRPDLAPSALPQVQAPTLLIVGGYDFMVLNLNRDALRALNAEKELAVVPQATHLFEEPGALEEVARLAEEWFLRYLAPGQRRGET